MTPRRYWIVVSAILVLTLARIASTYQTFAQIMDEPVHLSAGHEWLTEGTYTIDFQHPPMPRVLFALPFRHVRTTHPNDTVERGNDLLADGDRYIHNLARARRGNLLFVAIAVLALAASTRKLFGDAVAIVAIALFVSLPPVLAHGGLATTDMPAVAGFALAFWALLLWTEEPSWWRSILLGATIAFGICCKYSFPVFFPLAMIVTLIARRRFAPAKLLMAFVVAGILTWGAFGFSFRTMADANPGSVAMARAAGVSERWTHVRLPAPDLVTGYLAVRAHNRAGHPAFLLGRISDSGWWYYFPVVLGVKTPIPYLLLAAAGIWLVVKGRRAETFLIVVAAAILAIAMCSRINIGIRHILPIYIPLSMLAAFAVVELWPSARAVQATVAAALAWLVVSSALAHPDYIPWMNAFAGREPYRVLLDSNYDWGQDIWRLARICRKRGITRLGYSVVTSIRPTSIGITGGEILQENKPSYGWVVIGEGNLELARVKNPTAFEWLDRRRFERVGKTLRLYWIPLHAAERRARPTLRHATRAIRNRPAPIATTPTPRDPESGRVLATIPAPGGGGDSGLAWAKGTLWVGQYRDRKIHQIDPETGAILRTIESNRFVTGVTWVDGELWHGTWEGDESDLPAGVNVSGLESDGGDRFFCGGGRTGKVRAVRRPR